MIMDSLRTCHTTVMYLWGRDRPPVPVRWFFAEPGAEVFPYAHSFWNVDWEMDKGYKGDNDLIGERGKYANGSTFVHYPGTHFHGPAQAFIDGGRWGIDPPLTTGPDGAIAECRIPPDSPPGWLVGDVTQAQNPESHACGLLGYGMTLRQRQYPESHMCSGYWMPAKVIQAEKPAADFDNGFGIAGDVRQAQTPAANTAGVTPISTSVVQAQSPAAFFDGFFSILGDVVQAQSPAADAGSGYTVDADVAQAQTPDSEQSGSGEGGGGCGPVPEIRSSRLGTIQSAAIYEMGLPVGVSDGDLVLLFFWEATAPASAGLPVGWTYLDSQSVVFGSTSMVIAYKTWHTGDSLGVDIARSDGTDARGITVAVTGSGTPISGGFTWGTSGNEMCAAVDGGACPYLLLMGAGKLETGGNYNTPAGMTDLQPSPALDPVAVWYETPVAAGSSGARTASPDSLDEWVACLVACPPV